MLRTFFQLRHDDFVRYFRMNVASLTGSDYDGVVFNGVSLSPAIMVNVSLDWNEERGERIVRALGDLAKHNDTLLDLSGSHFNVTRSYIVMLVRNCGYVIIIFYHFYIGA